MSTKEFFNNIVEEIIEDSALCIARFKIWIPEVNAIETTGTIIPG